MQAALKKQVGQHAEQKACDFLQARGLHLLTRNYRCFCGEIDLVMRDGHDIVFVEVRSRTSSNYGSAVDSVNKTKQKKIIKSAIHYLQKQNWLEKVNYRFDIIGLSKTNLEWIKNAFSYE